jgi:hypothetical protein
VSEDPELKRLEERLDTAFATTRPRRGFEDELWASLERRRPFWARLGTGARRVNLLPYAGALAALVVVAGLGGLLLSGVHPGGGASTTSSQGGGAEASKQAGADNAGFGILPRPALRPTTSPAVNGTAPETAPTGSASAQYQGPVTVTAVTAQLALPASAPVARYREPTAADADRLAVAAGASPAGAAPPGALGRYSLSLYTVVVFPTDPAQGVEPRLVITSDRPPAAAAAPDESGAIAAAQAFLGRFQIRLDATAQGPAVERRGALLAVLWNRVFGASPSAIEAGANGPVSSWQVTVAGDLTVASASVAVPLPLDYAQYALADAQQLARAAMVAPAGPANLPQVVLDTAQLVYVVAGDGAYGYFEPAVMYTGHFTQNGVQYEKRVILPAVAAQDLR